MKKAVLVGSLLLSFVGGCSFGVGMMLWDSAEISQQIDLCKPKGQYVCVDTVTTENFLRLKEDMSMAEVESILGKGGCEKAEGVGSYNCKWYSATNEDALISIEFISGKARIIHSLGIDPW